jgi:hypothetical protein
MIIVALFPTLILMVVTPVFAPVLMFLAVASPATVMLFLRQWLGPILMFPFAVRDAQRVREVQGIGKPLGHELGSGAKRPRQQQEHASRVSDHVHLEKGWPMSEPPTHYLAPIRPDRAD